MDVGELLSMTDRRSASATSLAFNQERNQQLICQERKRRRRGGRELPIRVPRHIWSIDGGQSCHQPRSRRTLLLMLHPFLLVLFVSLSLLLSPTSLLFAVRMCVCEGQVNLFGGQVEEIPLFARREKRQGKWKRIRRRRPVSEFNSPAVWDWNAIRENESDTALTSRCCESTGRVRR